MDVSMHLFIAAAMNRAIEFHPKKEDEIIAFVKRLHEPGDYPFNPSEVAFAIRRRYPPVQPKKKSPIPLDRYYRR